MGHYTSLSDFRASLGSTHKADPSFRYRILSGGRAVIPVYGILSRRPNALLNTLEDNTSIDDVRSMFELAMRAPGVQRILLDIDSPGGSIDGVDGLSSLIFKSRGKKSIIAYASGEMLGAAYWIGSAADKVYATIATRAGSIGICNVVNDYTVANHLQGVKTEFVKAGRYKAAGHPDKPFTEEDRGVVQDEVDAFYGIFLDAIKRNRNLSDKEVEAVGEGQVFIGSQALKVRLIDGIGEADSV